MENNGSDLQRKNIDSSAHEDEKKLFAEELIRDRYGFAIDFFLCRCCYSVNLYCNIRDGERFYSILCVRPSCLYDI